jgi:hypothetical protein
MSVICKLAHVIKRGPSQVLGQVNSIHSLAHLQFVPHNLPTFSLSRAGTPAAAMIRHDTLQTSEIGMSIDTELRNDIESFSRSRDF